MIKTFGSELKELRTILKLSQRQLTNNEELLSQSSLQRIEKNEQMPSFDLAMLLINQLEVNLEELNYRLHDFDISEKDKLINEFRNIGSSANIKGITSLLTKMNSFLKKESSEIIRRLTLILQALLIFQEEQKFDHARAIVKPIWEKLQKQDEWLYNDMLVISNILFLFEEDAYLTMKKLLIEQIKKYSGLKNVNRIHIITLVNSVLYMKKKNRFLEAEDELDSALDLIIKQKDEKIRYYDVLCLKAETMWLKGKQDEATNLATSAFIKLYCLEEFDILNDNRNEWEELTGQDTQKMLQPLTDFLNTLYPLK